MIGRRPISRAGVTLVELTIFLVVSAVVIGSVLPLVTSQLRAFSGQRDLLDASETLRSSAAVLSWELRQISPSGGDLIAADSTSFVIRSTTGFGIVCADHATLPRLGVVISDGEFNVGDSILGFAAGTASPRDDQWLPLTLLGTLAPGPSGVVTCDWAGTTPDVVIEVAGDTTQIVTGAPLRTFRVVEFGLFSSGGRSWIGRRAPGIAAWDTLGGPVRAAAAGGLVFDYLDAAGTATTDPADIRTVQITIRSESAGRSIAIGSGVLDERGDSLTTRVHLRG